MCSDVRPTGVPRLYDLVRVHEDKLRPAFFYALGDTIVADNLEQAMRIAYDRSQPRWSRAVTLQVAQLIFLLHLFQSNICLTSNTWAHRRRTPCSRLESLPN